MTPNRFACELIPVLRLGSEKILGVRLPERLPFPKKNEENMKSNHKSTLRNVSGSLRYALCGAAVLPFILSVPARAEVETDRFLVRLTNKYTLAYWDRETGATQSLTVLKPVVDDGYFYLGSVPVGSYSPIQDPDSDDKKPSLGTKLPTTMILKPKSGYENMLAAPLRFENVWDDKGTGGRMDGTFFKAICPEGYAALGGVVREERSIKVEDEPCFRCVKEEILSAAAWEKDPVWADHKSGGAKNGAIWKSQNAGTPPPHYLYILSNTGFPTKGYNPPDENAYAIKFYFENVPDITGALDKTVVHSLNETLPKLTRNFELEAVDTTEAIQLPTYKVPFYLINDPTYDMLTQWQNYPVYDVNRSVYWEKIAEQDATGVACVNWGEADDQSTDYTVGSDKVVTWNNSIGAEIGFSSTISAKPLGAGTEATVSVSASYSHEFGGSESENKSRTISHTWKTPPGTYAALYQQFSTFVVKRSDGTVINANAIGDKYGHVTIRKAVYQPEGWSSENPCGPYPTVTSANASPVAETAGAGTAPAAYAGYMSIEEAMATDESSVVLPSSDDGKHEHHLLDAGHSLVKEKKHVSKSGNHYLIFQETGNLVVYTKDGAHVWNLRDQISRAGHITKIVYQNDGNLAAYDEKGAYMWSALHKASPAGTALHLTDEGILQIVYPDKTVAWSSAK